MRGKREIRNPMVRGEGKGVNIPPEKQERVLDAAIEEFSQKGYARASMNAVVERAGISKGALFNYFGSKSGLFAFVYKMALERIKGYLKAVREQSKGEPFFSRLEKVMWAGVIFIRNNSGLARIYHHILFTGDSPYKASILEELQRESMDFLEGLIVDGIEGGDLRPDLDPRACSFMIQCVIDRFLQAHNLEFVGNPLGLYQAQEEISRAWIQKILDVLRKGMAWEGTVASGSKDGL
jgi:AcrR family transcriptional regulator